eukprot:5519261-Amphidinium_carterae.1
MQDQAKHISYMKQFLSNYLCNSAVGMVGFEQFTFSLTCLCSKLRRQSKFGIEKQKSDKHMSRLRCSASEHLTDSKGAPNPNIFYLKVRELFECRATSHKEINLQICRCCKQAFQYHHSLALLWFRSIVFRVGFDKAALVGSIEVGRSKESPSKCSRTFSHKFSNREKFQECMIVLCKAPSSNGVPNWLYNIFTQHLIDNY